MRNLWKSKLGFTEFMYIGNLILIVGNFSDILFKEFLNKKRKAGIWKEPCKMGIWM